jgi:hypothetical protein
VTGSFARLDELTAITLRFEDEMAGRPADVDRPAQGHGQATDDRAAETGRLTGEGVPAAEITEHLDQAGQ